LEVTEEEISTASVSGKIVLDGWCLFFETTCLICTEQVDFQNGRLEGNFDIHIENKFLTKKDDEDGAY
jgi:hypothetical protein